ncbi:hypothetical protein GCM10009854_37870 [Saccharopolyspora halophila]|uniref:Chaplin domain-containing protein n=1 Tax=Saccharopolyspora halophila TaxID=405551 RepID=A0ABN3GN89_9PSEU
MKFAGTEGSGESSPGRMTTGADWGLNVRTSARLIGAAAAATAMLAIGSPAFADSADNDGVNVLNDNNASVLPIQLCGNNVAALGITAPIASPNTSNCVNAPIVDHPQG